MPEAQETGDTAKRVRCSCLKGGALASAKQGAERKGQTILCVDESGFYPLPGVVRTYAPMGERPVLREWCTRDHLSAISAVTLKGRLFFRVQRKAFNSAGVIDFLRQLLRLIPGKLLIIWDGSPIHRSKLLRGFLRSKAQGRVQLERLPAIAPDLNPDEGVWQHLKNVELRNLCCPDLDELLYQLHSGVRRIRRKPALVRSFVRRAGL